MVSVLEVPADVLISKLSEKLKQHEEIRPPEWASHAKTGVHAQRQPQSPDWWYFRCASLLRVIYMEPNVGVGRLRTKYGGRRARGTKPEHHYDASGNVIRKALQQLEKSGYVKKGVHGRMLTPQGKSLLDKVTNEIKGPRAARKELPKEVEKVERTGGAAEEKGAGAPRKAAAKVPRPAGKRGAGVPKKKPAAKAAGTRSKGKAGKTAAGKP